MGRYKQQQLKDSQTHTAHWFFRPWTGSNRIEWNNTIRASSFPSTYLISCFRQQRHEARVVTSVTITTTDRAQYIQKLLTANSASCSIPLLLVQQTTNTQFGTWGFKGFSSLLFRGPLTFPSLLAGSNFGRMWMRVSPPMHRRLRRRWQWKNSSELPLGVLLVFTGWSTFVLSLSLSPPRGRRTTAV